MGGKGQKVLMPMLRVVGAKVHCPAFPQDGALTTHCWECWRPVAGSCISRTCPALKRATSPRPMAPSRAACGQWSIGGIKPAQAPVLKGHSSSRAPCGTGCSLCCDSIEVQLFPLPILLPSPPSSGVDLESTPQTTCSHKSLLQSPLPGELNLMFRINYPMFFWKGRRIFGYWTQNKLGL